jgi:alkyl sulfatase BDS1-like metallo-beta-lactamase superfamily hydrolase
MTSILELADRMWAGEADLVHEHHPVSMWLPAGEEIAEGLYVRKGTAGANTVDTGDGLVMLDTGGQLDTGPQFAEVRQWRPDAPLVAAVYSHHHVDHVFGTAPFEAEAAERAWPAPRVYAHADLPAHFDRYLRTRGWNRAINSRQFGIYTDRFQWPDSYRFPDVTYRDRLTFGQGGLTFELHHARGETDDATWTWVPERRFLHPGDLFIWAVPNAGNPQKVQRYVSDWAVALREMAALGAEVMLAGHGLPLVGADRIRQALTDTADLLDSLEAQTLALMNEGAALDRVIHEVEVPAHLRDKPYLQPVYDHPQFVVRNVWRRYGGWHDGEPDNLLPAPRAEQAREWVALAGGVDAVLARVRELQAAGDLRLACHLVEFAALAVPDAADAAPAAPDAAASAAHEVRADVYAARAGEQTSSMARNILNHAALASGQGRRDLAGR